MLVEHAPIVIEEVREVVNNQEYRRRMFFAESWEVKFGLEVNLGPVGSGV